MGLVAGSLVCAAGLAAGFVGPAANAQTSRPQVGQVAQTQQPRTSNHEVKTTAVKVNDAVGDNYYYTYQYKGNTWVDAYYTYVGSNANEDLYQVFANFKECTAIGTDCIDSNAYTWQYLLYWHPNHTWYYFGPSNQYTPSNLGPQVIGYGPYPG